MNLVTVQLRDMIQAVKDSVLALLLGANMRAGQLQLRMCLVTYEPISNSVIITHHCRNCGQTHAARYLLDAPEHQYRWN